MDSHTILRRRAELLASTMDGETVMLDVETGHYFGLSGVGPHIWSMLEQDRSVGAIVDGVKAHFAVGPEDSVSEDVLAFLQKLVDKGLVMVAG
ncbi:hypothetical protein ABIE65_000358 [Constrictibacter sp. MBR-5]